MKEFQSKEEVFNYILEEIAGKAKTVLVRGDVANARVGPFTDFNIEIYSRRKRPIYEIHLCMGYPILICAYFYDYKFGSLLLRPKNVKMIKGSYTSGIEEMFDKEATIQDKYNERELIVRKFQLLMEFFFKFIRTKDKKCLDHIQKSMDFKSIPKMPESENPAESETAE